MAEARVVVKLVPVVDCLGRLAGRHERAAVDAELLRARLSDVLRDAGLDPLDPDEVDGECEGLDEEGWKLLAMLAAALREPCMLPHTPALARTLGARALLLEGLIGAAAGAAPLTAALVQQSELRAEELGRRWLLALRAEVEGETAEQSSRRLARLDSRALRERAEQARARGGPPRGKW